MGRKEKGVEREGKGKNKGEILKSEKKDERIWLQLGFKD
jgi:hypothetical protein